MTESRFDVDLDALVRGEQLSSGDELTRFVSDLYGKEQNVTMPYALKLRVAGELGLEAGAETAIPAPVSRRTLRSSEPLPRSSRPWAIALTFAAAVLLALTGVLRWGLPTGTDDGDNHFLFSSPAVPTVSATPAATPASDSDWTMPVSAEECPEDELISRGDWIAIQSVQAANYVEDSPRQDAPYVMAEPGEAEEVVLRQRSAIACMNSNDEGALPIESDRYSNESRAEPEAAESIQASLATRGYDLSAWVEDDLGMTPDDFVIRNDTGGGAIWLPTQAVEMADGRIALLPGWVTTSSDSLPGYTGVVPVWQEIDGVWMLDEQLPFCIGNCDNYWAGWGLEPSATPEATPSDVSSWIQPLSVEECAGVISGDLPQVTGEEFDAFPQRQNVVAGPSNPDDAFAANETARQYMACEYPPSLLSERYVVEMTLAGEEFSPYNVVLLDRQLRSGIDLSAQLQDQGVTPDDTVIELDAETMEGEGTFIPNPTLAFELEDGRILIMSVHASNSSSQSMGTTLILVKESGEWKVDDHVPLCIGECDDVWSQLETLYSDALWLSPVAAEECEANAYLPAGLTDDQAAAIKSRQYRACEANGDASSLQGPDYRPTEGDDARMLSEEIESLHRQNGQMPGSLQRIANEQVLPMYEFPDEPWAAFQPHSVVTLADGRIAVLQTRVVSPEIVSGSGRTSPVVTTALVWIVDGDDWLLDEEVTVCLGNCDAFWNDASEPAATPAATIVAIEIPETCEAGELFSADFVSHDRLPIQLRPGPGNVTGFADVIAPNTPLQFLCESELTTSPAADRMEEGQVWLHVISEDGSEGWIREVDVRPVD